MHQYSFIVLYTSSSYLFDSSHMVNDIGVFCQHDPSSLKDYLRIRSTLLAQRYGAPAISEQR